MNEFPSCTLYFYLVFQAEKGKFESFRLKSLCIFIFVSNTRAHTLCSRCVCMLMCRMHVNLDVTISTTTAHHTISNERWKAFDAWRLNIKLCSSTRLSMYMYMCECAAYCLCTVIRHVCSRPWTLIKCVFDGKNCMQNRKRYGPSTDIHKKIVAAVTVTATAAAIQ